MLLLQSRGRLTAAELAAELEVSVRTIHRDVEALSAAGVPVYAERGPYGGIRLVDGYRTRLTGLTGDEAEAIFLSGLPGPAAELGLGTVVAAARLKVLASLPSELRTRASRLVERFHLDASGWFQAGEPVPHLTAVSDAVWESRRLRIEYARGDATVQRVIDPLGLVLKGGVWYLVASTEDQIRTYRISRVVQVETLDDRFDRPPGFDLAGYWADSSAAYEENAARVEVVVRVDPRGMGYLTAAVGEQIVAAAERIAEPDDEGWTRLRLRLDWPNEVPGRLLGVGPRLEVLEPPEIRRRVIELARAVVRRYPDPDPGPAPA